MPFFRSVPRIDSKYVLNDYAVLVDGIVEGGTASGLFAENATFNDAVFIGDAITDCSSLLANCRNFNSPLHLGKNVSNCANMLYWCNNFQQHCEYVFPKRTLNFFAAFYGTKIYGNIFINATEAFSTRLMLYRVERNNILNVFCNNLNVFDNNTFVTSTPTESLFIPVDNGYFVNGHNIYLYRNYIGS